MAAKTSRNNNLIRTITIVIVLIGAVISAILTINAGHKNTSAVLPALFLIWVLSPFIMLLFINYKFKRYRDNGSIIQYIVMMLVATFSVIAYTGILNPVDSKPAAVFLFTPLISWVLIIIFMLIKPKAKQP